jgi:hypothetical protein
MTENMSRFHEYLAKRSNIPNMADSAISMGVPVFPCDAQKRPLTAHGFKDASANPDIIRRMFFNSNAVMIGMPTGETTSLVVIDVDVKDGAQGAAWLDANCHRMPQTRTIKTGSGGLHLYFVWPGYKIRNSASKIAPGIDVRGDGGYVIVPPSIGYSIADNANPAELPEWLIPALVPPERTAEQIQQPTRYNPPARLCDGETHYGRAALDRECENIRNAADGTKHDVLNKAAFSIGGLVSSGQLSEKDAFAALSNALEFIRHSCKDFRHAQNTLSVAFRDGIGKPRNIPASPTLEPLAPAVATIVAQLLKRQSAKIIHSKPLDIPPALLDVPGVLRLFVDHCEATAISPQPFLSLAAGICLIGALAGRRFRTTTDLRTNIYAVGVADSGAGKDHARKQIRKCLYAANLVQYLGGSDIASGAGMRTAMVRHPSMLFQIDEFGDWLHDVLGEKAASHRKQIAANLKELYSSANSIWQGAEYADQSKLGRPREDVHQPNACLYGTTTPGQFWNAIAGASLNDGLMARILLFVSPCSYPDEREPDLSEPSDGLIAALQAIASGPEGQVGNLGGLMLSSAAPAPLTVQETPDAVIARRAMRQEQLDMQRKAEGTYVTAIAGRLAENAMKLALIRAVAANSQTPLITVADIAWGRALALHCVNTLLRDASRHVAENEYEAKLNKALDIIRKHGPVTEREMIRRGFRLPERERKEILGTLEAGRMVLVIRIKPGANGGRPTERYTALEPINPASAESDDDE